MTTNPVFQVLVPKGNQALLAAGSTVEALAVGQMGFFDYNTNLSLNASSPVPSEFYFAVGVDTNGDSVKDKVLFSAGHKIPVRANGRIVAVEDKCSVAALGKIVEISGFTADCETDYSVKIEVRNQQGYLYHGYNPIRKTFDVTTGCCDDGCTTGDCDASSQPLLALALAQAINSDPDDVFQAYLWDPVGAVEVDFDAVAQYIADNPTGVLTVRILSEASKPWPYNGSVNLGYFQPRGTDIIVSLIQGFECNGTTAILREMIYSEGDGYDIQNLEYEAGGWNGNPGVYRTNNTDVAKNIFYQAVIGTKYTQIDFSYDLRNTSGWMENENDLRTTIAIPCTDATTFASFKAFLLPTVTAAGFAFKTTTCPCVTDEVPPAEEEGGPGVAV
jgi:hypothetical protein